MTENAMCIQGRLATDDLLGSLQWSSWKQTLLHRASDRPPLRSSKKLRKHPLCGSETVGTKVKQIMTWIACIPSPTRYRYHSAGAVQMHNIYSSCIIGWGYYAIPSPKWQCLGSWLGNFLVFLQNIGVIMSKRPCKFVVLCWRKPLTKCQIRQYCGQWEIRVGRFDVHREGDSIWGNCAGEGSSNQWRG